jgi:hypothetical protein
LATRFIVVATVPAFAAIFRVVVQIRALVVADPVVQHRAVAGAFNTVLFRSALVVALAAMVQVRIQENAIAAARFGFVLETFALAVVTPLSAATKIAALTAVFLVAFQIDATIVFAKGITFFQTDALTIDTARELVANLFAFAAVFAIGLQIDADIVAQLVIRVPAGTLPCFAHLLKTTRPRAPSAVFAIGLRVYTVAATTGKRAIGLTTS